MEARVRIAVVSASQSALANETRPLFRVPAPSVSAIHRPVHVKLQEGVHWPRAPSASESMYASYFFSKSCTKRGCAAMRRCFNRHHRHHHSSP